MEVYYKNYFQIDFDDEEVQGKSYVKDNMLKIYLNFKVFKIMQRVDKHNSELCNKNITKILLEIPKMQKKKDVKELNFTRFDVHEIYTIYKSLH